VTRHGRGDRVLERPRAQTGGVNRGGLGTPKSLIDTPMARLAARILIEKLSNVYFKKNLTVRFPINLQLNKISM